MASAKRGGGGHQAAPKRRSLLLTGRNPHPSGSIREFCDLSIPILMFDKYSDYLVLRLEEVCPAPCPSLIRPTGKLIPPTQLLPLSFGPEALPTPGTRSA